MATIIASRIDPLARTCPQSARAARFGPPKCTAPGRAGVLLTLLLLPTSWAPAGAQTTYKLPPDEVVRIVDAPPTPLALVSPTRDAMLLVEYQSNPPIALLARPFVRLGGLRVDPATGCLQRTLQYTGIVVQGLEKGGAARRVELPAGARIGVPVWSNDGKHIVFARDLDAGVELWIADAKSGKAHAVAELRLDDVLGAPITWMHDNRHLLVRAIAKDRGQAPPEPKVPLGPDVSETMGKRSRMATYQDLLASTHDEDLFKYFAMTQLLVVDSESGKSQTLGAPGMYLSAKLSPNEKCLLATRIERPFSFRVPYYFFSRSVEVLDQSGKSVATIARLPVSDEVPQQGVPTGPREAEWAPLEPATLVWAEALDGGDPIAKAPFRDKLVALRVGVDKEPRDVVRLKQRYTGIEWTVRKGEVLATEYDRDRRWRTTAFVDLAAPDSTRRVVFDLSVNDSYKDPGEPVHDVRPDGQRTMLQDDEWIYLTGKGASDTGDRPFLDRYNLETQEKQRLFQSDKKSYEQVYSFVKGSRTLVLTRYESRTEPPNFFLVDLRSGERTKLTDFKDPAPQLGTMRKELQKYRRADGVQLTGILYLPPSYETGTRLPLVLWAYPLEYSDAGTAGQVRGSQNTFTRFVGPSQLLFVTQGYAVLDNATMPVIGDPETMNDTFVEQIVGAAKAAIDHLDSLGVIDPRRVCVGGHSYGAFMTASLLAHSDLFAAGIARSGAYNRSLTPFGFQSERRSYLGGDRRLHEAVTVHLRQQDPRAHPPHARQGGQQPRHLHHPVGAHVPGLASQRRHGAPRAPAARGPRLPRARVRAARPG
jgi:dipeptidyl aminopeptidase/acylaminoacyl peptidase